jgi:NAD-dependent dihydropyrimidine dehydrogenase PreA subunit
LKSYYNLREHKQAFLINENTNGAGTMSSGRFAKAQIVDLDACMECGVCAKNCDTEAIIVESGVGCATVVIIGAPRGTEATCDCSGD